MRPIGHIRTDFDAKFGIPRQSGLVPQLMGKVVFLPEYRRPEAFRELEGFSHLWLIWQFSLAGGEDFRPTVRPPRLGGNRRVGVFASRSPFHPNRLGLSCVRLIRVDENDPEGPVLWVSGIDMLDGTPIFDVKPYVPVADCVPDAAEGYTAQTREHGLNVSFENGLESLIPAEKLDALIGVLENDPRPGFEDSPEKEYGLSFSGFDVGFKVSGENLTVFRVDPPEN
ncbi:MAG: tRNA (N6-threonylcarbamoyladenosine(37)-N6)-methyltransferase TrmO [Clostridia bacterium]|nr:tRNA (N6-threonylcarbamoyladenosine(37)-N6)-methyltransferase TrmO [Clostridia bacterium]